MFQFGRIILLSLLIVQSSNVLGQTKDIVQTIIDSGNYTTLVNAITVAGLVDTLKGPGPFTVFAPTDAAFAKLPAGVVDELVKPENKDSLARMLKYHVASGNLTAADLDGMGSPANLTMVDGGYSVITKTGTTLKINDAVIIEADTFATNGIIHTIDTVILPSLNIIETAIVNGNFKTLIAALKAADLFATLKGDGPFTVLAPDDAAFNKLPPGTVDDLLKPENKEKLAKILKYHVIGKRVSSSDIKGMNLPVQVETLSGVSPIIDVSGNSVRVNSATVTAADVQNTNGFIHIIDTVLLIPTDVVQTAIDNGGFKKLVSAITAADLADALKGAGPFTVFAPTDAAFDKLAAGVLDELLKAENKDLLKKILQYHVTNQIITSSSIDRMNLPRNVSMLAGTTTLSKDGNNVKIDGATITTADIFNSNGMIHVIDTVILPPLDIVETAIINGNFKTLVTALKAADLVTTLKGDGPFTVFAPNDAAFGKLPAGVVDELVKAENKDSLQKILKYHVVNKKLSSADIVALGLPANLTMLNGNTAIISKDGNTIKINNIPITTADVSNKNGFIHIIDSVTLPPLDIIETVITSGTFQKLLIALKAADLVSTLKGNGPFTIFAPNDDAFAKLPAGAFDDLIKPENKNKLSNTLQYHVVKDRRILSTDLTPPESLEMLAGGKTEITKSDNQIKINDAKIIKVDIGSTNGVSHVIDNVLTPRTVSSMSMNSSQGFLILLLSFFLFSYHFVL